MTEIDIRQQELDLAERQFLTDVFGGHEPERFVFRVGILKYDFSDKVQKVLNDFESIIKPIMNDEGKVNLSELRKRVSIDYINIPEGEYRPIELYRKIQPLVTGLKEYILGVR